MKDTKEIITSTLEELERQSILATPINFEKEFFKQLKKSDLVLEENTEIKEIISRLTDEEKEKIHDDFSFRVLANILSKRISNQEIRAFLKDFSSFLIPSIDITIKEELDEVCKKLAKTPSELIHDNTIRKLKKLTNVRVSNDKKHLSDKASDVKKLIHFLSNHLNIFLTQNTTTINEIVQLKDEISSLKLSESSIKELEELQQKLIEKIEMFQDALGKNKIKIVDNQIEFHNLFQQIEQLQCELDRAEEEKSVDFLTKVLTRRAYTLEVEKMESEYNIFDTNYAIIFYDLDHFKKINDNYGHDCGDFVLATFASILKNLTRTGDIIARYGGEEFVSLVNYKNKFEVMNYLRRVKNLMSNNRFVYDDIKLNVEFSAGVAFRKNYNSYDETLKKADELLYDAKGAGRNQIILESGEVL